MVEILIDVHEGVHVRRRVGRHHQDVLMGACANLAPEAGVHADIGRVLQSESHWGATKIE
jgi:hypothetical protein